MVRPVGFEPTPVGLKDRCATITPRAEKQKINWRSMQDSNPHYRLRTPAFSSIKLIEQIGAHGLDLNRHHLPYKGSALPLSDVSIFFKS